MTPAGHHHGTCHLDAIWNVVPNSLAFGRRLKSQHTAEIVPFYKYCFALSKEVAFVSEGVTRALQYKPSLEAESDLF